MNYELLWVNLLAHTIFIVSFSNLYQYPTACKCCLCVIQSAATESLSISCFCFCVASGTVVSCMTTMISSYGTDSQKGAVLGVFRALGALARALGPVIASAGRYSMPFYIWMRMILINSILFLFLIKHFGA